MTARLHHVKKARKTYRGTGVKKGCEYWWWSFKFGPRHMSLTKPPRSRLTRSAFLGTIWDLEDGLKAQADALAASEESLEALAAACEQAAEEVRALGQECASTRDNMPQQLQDNPSNGGLLQERAEACETIADALEDAASQVRDAIGDLDGVANGDGDSTAIENAANAVTGVSWDAE